METENNAEKASVRFCSVISCVDTSMQEVGCVEAADAEEEAGLGIQLTQCNAIVTSH